LKCRTSILFVIDTMYTGGAQKVLSLITKTLLPHYEHVGVFVLKKTESYFFVEGVDYYFAIEEKEKLTANLFPILNQLSNVMKHYDSIVGFMDFAANYLTSLAATLNQKPYRLSVRCHISDILQTYEYRELNQNLVQLCYGNAKQVICNSEASRKDLIDNFSVDYHKTVLLRNCIDVSKTLMLSKERVPDEHQCFFNGKTIVAIGRLCYQKNYETLIKAFKILSERYKEPLTLLILGEGEFRQKIEILIEDLNMRSKVFLLGEQSNICAYLAQADIFVHVTLFEGFPNTLLEAAVLQIPIVASNIDAIQEFIGDEKNGLLVDPMQSEAIAIALERLLLTPSLGFHLSTQAYQDVLLYDIETFNNTVLRLFCD